jgi:hypothetical protein
MGINRTQALVLGFLVAAWLSLIAILMVAPDVFAGALQMPRGGSIAPELAFLIAISALIGLLCVGVVRRWRWMFWLILLAFLVGGALRLPASALELAGTLPMGGPAWYVLLQATIGVIQFAIGLAMLSGLRAGGIWGPFRLPRRSWRGH